MRKTVDTIIQPDYEGNHTETWKDKRHPDIFPAVYRRYRAPEDAGECEQMVRDLSELITLINDQYNEVRDQSLRLGIEPSRDLPTKERLKQIRSARNRHEAIRRAYIFWMSDKKDASEIVRPIGKTQYSTRDRIDAVAAGLKKVTDVLIADLSGESSDQDLLGELVLLRRQLEVVFVSPS
jgi:hypothetical protein